MTEKEKDKEKDRFAEIAEELKVIVAKLDSLEKRVPPEDKEDSTPEPNPQIEKAEGALRIALKDKLPQEKLDSMKIDELSLAMELIPHMKKEMNDPPASKNDSDKKPPKLGEGTDVSAMLEGAK